MKPRRYFPTLCVLLLLFAQQVALSHAAWHALGHAPGAVHAHDHTDGHAGHHGDPQHHHPEPLSDGQAHLCEFDAVFGQVLGGVHGVYALPLVADLPASIATCVFNPRLGSEAVPALSRGPPPRL